MQRNFSLIYLTLFWTGVMSAIVLVSQDQEVTMSLGMSATLRCSLKGETISNYYISWYRQTQGNTMTFIHREGGMYGRGFFGKFRANINDSSNEAELEILKASERDEGIYYCACNQSSPFQLISQLLDTASSNKLIFGKGVRVIVEPKNQPPAKPSVFIMKNGTNVACLVKDFYPKNVDISLQSSKKIIEFDPAIVVSPSGKYSAVKLGRYEDSNSVTCSVQHNKIWYSANFEKMTNSSDHLKPMEPEKKHQTSEIYHKPKATVHAEKVNMMSLTVLGLRVLFAKTVAVNFLLTAKLLFC
uniref:Ig-like domain-containing protein n=1 Tax=Myotis lucifugus TaxID=59463 RepID=G1Q7B8_MYOLU